MIHARPIHGEDGHPAVDHDQRGSMLDQGPGAMLTSVSTWRAVEL